MTQPTYIPIMRDHVSKLLVDLPTVGPLETQYFLDNLDHLLLNTDFLYEHEWRARSGFAVPIPRFDAAIAGDHHLITIEMEDMSKSNAVSDVSGYRARLCIEDRVMAEGRIVATEARALYELYEAVNAIAEKYGRGRRRYIMEEGAL